MFRIILKNKTLYLRKVSWEVYEKLDLNLKIWIKCTKGSSNPGDTFWPDKSGNFLTQKAFHVVDAPFFPNTCWQFVAMINFLLLSQMVRLIYQTLTMKGLLTIKKWIWETVTRLKIVYSKVVEIVVENRRITHFGGFSESVS